MNWSAERVIEAYWEYSQPRVGRVGPKGYERPGVKRGNVKFWAWLRVVTEPSYSLYEKELKGGWECPGFEEILTESLKLVPFAPPTEVEAKLIRIPLIPVGAALIYAHVNQSTISRWIDKGLKHEKRGSRYWVDLGDLELFMTLKGRQKSKRKRTDALDRARIVYAEDVA